jgi:hypothetical protein
MAPPPLRPISGLPNSISLHEALQSPNSQLTAVRSELCSEDEEIHNEGILRQIELPLKLYYYRFFFFSFFLFYFHYYDYYDYYYHNCNRS